MFAFFFFFVEHEALWSFTTHTWNLHWLLQLRYKTATNGTQVAVTVEWLTRLDCLPMVTADVWKTEASQLQEGAGCQDRSCHTTMHTFTHIMSDDSGNKLRPGYQTVICALFRSVGDEAADELSSRIQMHWLCRSFVLFLFLWKQQQQKKPLFCTVWDTGIQY